ncbi:MAG: hypothetical protein ABJF05_03260, partial [Paracoccaceae bacterium]
MLGPTQTSQQSGAPTAHPVVNRFVLLRSLMQRVVVFVVLLVLMSLLPRLLPGDTLDVLLDSNVQRGLQNSEIADLRDRLGLAGSLVEQVGRDLARLAHGDLGYSLLHGAPVN